MRMVCLIVFLQSLLLATSAHGADEAAARQTLERAAGLLRSISTNGGYVGIYSLDLKKRYGEAVYEKAGATQIWVQPPGTPSVGELFLRAHRVTGNQDFLDLARDAGRALAWGQRKQGGWDHRVDVAHLTPDATAPDRKSGRCTFDDDITQGAIKFLMQLDEELDESWLDDSVRLALQFVMEAQFDSGGWPQWYPLRGGYHDYYTYNDNSINDCILVMSEAHRRYGEPAYLESARRGGDFIIASQLPAPQSGWAQQHSHDLKPAWARSFEPPGVCSAATARNIRTLVDVYLYTGDEKYLGPIPAATDWLQRSRLPRDAILEDEVGGRVDSQTSFWARLYEVGTNRPVYGDRENPRKMIYDIRKVSKKERDSYGWQGTFGVPEANAYYQMVNQRGRDEVLRQRRTPTTAAARQRRAQSLEPQVRQIIAQLDEQGRWVTGNMLHISTFVRNMNLLCEYLEGVIPPKSDSSRRSVRMSGPLRIVAFGDSVTNGVGLAGMTEADTFRDIVRRELTERLGSKVEVVNAGVNGDVAPLAIGRLKRDVLNRKPDIVTIMFGGNEAGFYRPETNGFADTARVGREEFKATLAKIVDRIRAEGITVVLMTCPPMTERYWGMRLEPYQKHGINFLVKDYAQTMRDVAAEKSVELIDVYRAFQEDPGRMDFFPDGLHPDARGHRVIADLLTKGLTRIIDRRSQGEPK